MRLKRLIKSILRPAGRALLAPGYFDPKKGRWRRIPDVPDAPATVPADVVAVGSLTVVTFNVWFGEYYREERTDALFRILQDSDADIIALQEITPELLEVILETPWIRDTYSISDFIGESIAPYGVLLLSRLPVERWEIHHLPTRMYRALVTATLNINGTQTVVGVVHLESTKFQGATREDQMRVIFPILENGPHAFLMGDFNFCAIRDVENRALDPRYRDAWAALRPDDPGYTEDTERNIMRLLQTEKPKRARFDRVLVRSASPGWRAEDIRLLGTEPIDPRLPKVFPSDHFGVWARFLWDETAL